MQQIRLKGITIALFFVLSTQIFSAAAQEKCPNGEEGICSTFSHNVKNLECNVIGENEHADENPNYCWAFANTKEIWYEDQNNLNCCRIASTNESFIHDSLNNVVSVDSDGSM